MANNFSIKIQISIIIIITFNGSCSHQNSVNINSPLMDQFENHLDSLCSTKFDLNQRLISGSERYFDSTIYYLSTGESGDLQYLNKLNLIDKNILREHQILPSELNRSNFFDIKNGLYFFLEFETGTIRSFNIESNKATIIGIVPFANSLFFINDIMAVKSVRGLNLFKYSNLDLVLIKSIEHENETKTNSSFELINDTNKLVIAGIGLSNTESKIVILDTKNYYSPTWSIEINGNNVLKTVKSDDSTYLVLSHNRADLGSWIYKIDVGDKKSSLLVYSISDQVIIDIWYYNNSIIFKTAASVGCISLILGREIWRKNIHEMQSTILYHNELIVVTNNISVDKSLLIILDASTGKVISTHKKNKTISPFLDKYIVYDNTLYL